MQLTEVLSGTASAVHPIFTDCSAFLEEAGELPVLKNLPTHYNDFHRVKVRQRTRKDKFTETFNDALGDIPNLRQRSVTVNGTVSFFAETGEREPFYVFPIDGYKYKYSLEVTNSKEDYQEAFDTILEVCDDEEMMKLLLKYTYVSENLTEGVKHGSEIILYNIPYFYAMRASPYEGYTDLLQKIAN